MPRLWTDTIDAHRAEVRDAILDAAASLAAEHGPLAITMSQVAQTAGIGRATLYKYFPDVEAVLVAWHERHVADHLHELTGLAHGTGPVGQRLDAVLEHFAFIAFGRPHTDLAALLHRDGRLDHAEQRLTALLSELLVEATAAGEVRTDITAPELASYCLSALTAATSSPSRAAVRRLVGLTRDGLRP